MATRPLPPRHSTTASAAIRPPCRLSVAIWVTTPELGSRQAMSAVKTGMPAAVASLMAVATAFESQGQSTMALAFLTMKSLT